MIVTLLQDTIFCEYQIKFKMEKDSIAKKRNDFNHMLYEI